MMSFLKLICLVQVFVLQTDASANRHNTLPSDNNVFDGGLTKLDEIANSYRELAQAFELSDKAEALGIGSLYREYQKLLNDKGITANLYKDAFGAANVINILRLNPDSPYNTMDDTDAAIKYYTETNVPVKQDAVSKEYAHYDDEKWFELPSQAGNSPSQEEEPIREHQPVDVPSSVPARVQPVAVPAETEMTGNDKRTLKEFTRVYKDNYGGSSKDAEVHGKAMLGFWKRKQIQYQVGEEANWALIQYNDMIVD